MVRGRAARSTSIPSRASSYSFAVFFERGVHGRNLHYLTQKLLSDALQHRLCHMRYRNNGNYLTFSIPCIGLLAGFDNGLVRLDRIELIMAKFGRFSPDKSAANLLPLGQEGTGMTRFLLSCTSDLSKYLTFDTTCWGGHPYGLSISKTPETMDFVFG